jgi:hypothetical protein
VHVTANHGARPDGDVVTEFDLTEHDGTGINENPVTQFGLNTCEAAQAGSGVVW